MRARNPAQIETRLLGEINKFLYLKDNAYYNFGHVFFKGTMPRAFLLHIFDESVSPKPLSIPLGPFQIFSKIAAIFAAQGAPPVSLTSVANGKILQTEKF